MSVGVTLSTLMLACSPTPKSASTASSDSVSSAARVDTGQPLSAKVNLPQSSVRAGQPVAIRFVLTNIGAQDTEVSVVGSAEQRFDVTVLDSAGIEVWSRLHQQDIDLGRNVLPLRAGDSLVFAEQWDQRDNNGRPVAAGSYEVRAHLTPHTSGRVAPTSARLRICPAAGDC